jgi:hypothetical protein
MMYTEPMPVQRNIKDRNFVHIEFLSGSLNKFRTNTSTSTSTHFNDNTTNTTDNDTNNDWNADTLHAGLAAWNQECIHTNKNNKANNNHSSSYHHYRYLQQHNNTTKNSSGSNNNTMLQDELSLGSSIDLNSDNDDNDDNGSIDEVNLLIL